MRTTSLHLLALGLAAIATTARAQSLDPTPDTTPDIELDGSMETEAELHFDGTTWFIADELGKYSGSSLFHSFGRFDVPGGQTAEFSAVATPEHALPERVFARVTWGESTEIEGTLRSSIPGADLYLINPAGVHIEGGAQLDVQGSFHVTSAGRIGYPGGQSFSASASDPPPVLTIEEPSSYGFLPEGGGAIEFGLLTSGPLSVPPGETLAAVGGSVRLRSDNRRFTFSSPGSRIALVAAGPGVEVPIPLESFDPSAVASSVALGEVDLLASRIAASLPAGSIVVRAGSFRLESGAIGVNHDAVEPSAFDAAVDIAVRDDLSVLGRGGISTVTGGAAGRDIRLSGDVIAISTDSEVLSRTVGSESGSSILVRGDSLRLADGGRLRSNSAGAGAGGSIDLEVSELTLRNGGRILSEASGAGSGGPLRIQALRIDANDAGFSATGTVIKSATTFVAAPGSDAIENEAGSIEIDADQIVLSDGAEISSSTSGSGNAGVVRVRAREIAVSGIAFDASGTLSRAALIETRSLPGSTGHAGQPQQDALGATESVLGVSIETETLSVSNGAEVGTATQGSGAAGDLVLHATESVLLTGGASGPATLQSRATASLGNPSVGAGGRVEIATPTLELRDAGQITSATTGTGDAGSVEVHADQVLITGRSGGNESGIFAQTLAPGLSDAGGAGGVLIESSGDVALSDGAVISVETTNDQPAGNIVIDAMGSLRLDDATISAEATQDATAQGGSIEIAADRGVFLTGGSSIEARSSGTGRAGSIGIDAGPRLELTDSSISTESQSLTDAGGGVIAINADEQVMLTDSSIDTSVKVGGGDGGDVRIDPELVVLNRSDLLAQAQDGAGGRIFIRADSFVRSTNSLVSASSLGGGIDGTVVIESPESELNSERAQPAQEFLDAAGLLKTACGAGSGAGATSSFVVARVAGLPASPEGPLPAPLWDVLPQPIASTLDSTSMRDARPVRVAARAGGCQAVEEL